MRRTVLLHVGAPKTGTSFVQDLLLHHPTELAEDGVLYPADRFDAHFLAALDLMELPWGGLERQATGRWERLAEEVRAWQGQVIISHEILAAASPPHIARAVESLGGRGGGSELHVVMSVRDLVRQIPAEWQENVKHRRTVSYRQFLDEVIAPGHRSRVAEWFWSVQDIPAVLERWSAVVPPERVHVVTVPRPGAPPGLLWQRFAEVFHLDPEGLDLARAGRSNRSLGVREAALVRALNERLNDGVLSNEHYRELVREVLAHRTLARRPDAVRLRLPPDVHAWAAQRCEEWIADIVARGYHVVGSVDELRPEPYDGEGLGADEDPDSVLDTADPTLDLALDALVGVMLHGANRRREVDGLYARLGELTAERDRAWAEARLSLRARRRFIRYAQDHRAAAVALAAWRRAKYRGTGGHPPQGSR